jgi:hypothetical protein
MSEQEGMSREEIKFIRIQKLLEGFEGDPSLSLAASGLSELPYKELSLMEKALVSLCRNIFPFTRGEADLIERICGVAKGVFKNCLFSGLVLEPPGFYMRLSKNEDFNSVDDVSIFFGFYTEPGSGNLPEEVQIKSSIRWYSSSIKLMFARMDVFWGSYVLVTRLPLLFLKTPENAPFVVTFRPEGNYEHIKPIGITFSQREEFFQRREKEHER